MNIPSIANREQALENEYIRKRELEKAKPASGSKAASSGTTTQQQTSNAAPASDAQQSTTEHK